MPTSLGCTNKEHLIYFYFLLINFGKYFISKFNFLLWKNFNFYRSEIEALQPRILHVFAFNIFLQLQSCSMTTLFTNPNGRTWRYSDVISDRPTQAHRNIWPQCTKLIANFFRLGDDICNMLDKILRTRDKGSFSLYTTGCYHYGQKL